MVLEPHHRFHSYCARFPSRVAEAAINDYSKIGESIWDPFCGSGTTLVAGLAAKRTVVGSDVDVLAGMLSEVKCWAKSKTDYALWRARFSAKLEKNFAEIERSWRKGSRPRPGNIFSVGSLELRLPPFPELNYWFPPQLVAALASIADAAHECRDEHYEKVALVSLSAAIIAKWPNTLSYAMDIDHTRPHRRIQQFRLGAVLETYFQRLDRAIACLGSLHDVYAGNRKARAVKIVCPHDARTQLADVDAESQALVVTSPPYFNAVDYPRAHRMAVCWMNGHAPAELASRNRYIGLHSAVGFDPTEWLSARRTVAKIVPKKVGTDPTLLRRLTGFFADIEKVLVETRRTLRPGGHAVFVIGDNVVKGERVASHAALVELAKSLNFRKVSADSRSIEGPRRRYPVGPFGFNGPMTHEFVVVLQKAKEKRRPRRREP